MRKNDNDRILIELALREDIGSGDITSAAMNLCRKKGKAEVIAKAHGIISGVDLFKKVFQILSPRMTIKIFKSNGSVVKPGDIVLSPSGPLEKLLIGERTAMNIISHLSGVATLTSAFVQKVKKTKTKILDTRKTMPGMRFWEKEAVLQGGGKNHRIGLYDMYLIKENHIEATGGIRNAMLLAKTHQKKTRASIEIEVKNIRELKQAAAFNPDFILLDNFTIRQLKNAANYINKLDKKPVLESSGNVNLKNVAAIAATGVDQISIGKLTHSAPALDLSFRIIN